MRRRLVEVDRGNTQEREETRRCRLGKAPPLNDVRSRASQSTNLAQQEADKDILVVPSPSLSLSLVALARKEVAGSPGQGVAACGSDLTGTPGTSAIEEWV